MKRLILLSCWVVGALLAGPAWGQDQESAEEKPRAAIVNIQELFRQYYKTVKTQEQISAERARIQKEHNDMVGRLRSMEEGLRQIEVRMQREGLPSDELASLLREKGLRLQEAEALDQQRRDTVMARHGELNRKMVVRMENLLEEIRAIVVDQAERAGYDLVFDMDGLNTSQVPFLMYVKDATDITPTILKELNRDAPRRD